MLVVGGDEVEGGSDGVVEVFYEFSGWDGKELSGDDFRVHGRVGSAACHGGEAVDVGFRGEAEVVEFQADGGSGF